MRYLLSAFTALALSTALPAHATNWVQVSNTAYIDTHSIKPSGNYVKALVQIDSNGSYRYEALVDCYGQRATFLNAWAYANNSFYQTKWADPNKSTWDWFSISPSSVLYHWTCQ